MKLKSKIMAIVLSAATAASMLPQMAMAKITAPEKDGYLFWADFEDGQIPSGFEMTSGARWTQTVEDGAMKFTWNPDSATAGGTQDLMLLDVQTGDLTSTGYEYGFKIKLNGAKSLFPNLFKTYRAKSGAHRGTLSDISITDTNTILAKIYAHQRNDNYGMEKKTATLTGEGWLDVKVSVNFYNGVCTIDIMENGQPIITSFSKTGMGKNATTGKPQFYNNTGQGAYNALYELLLQVNDTNAFTAKESDPNYTESFYVDDIWVKKYEICKITFDTDGVGTAPDTMEIMEGEKLATMPADPTYSKETDMVVFKGWYTEQACTEEFDVDTAIAGNITLYAKWLPLYKVTFHYNNGIGTFVAETTKDVISEEEANTEIEMIADPERSGYEFKGWYLDNNTWEIPFDGTKLDEIDTDGNQIVDVYAKWETAYPVYFNSNGGTSVATKYTTNTLSELPTSTKSGYRFDYWYRADSPDVPFDGTLTEEEKLDGGVTVYAKWTKYWIVNFDSNGGSSVSKILTLEDLTKLPESSMSGKGFDGWYWDEELTQKFDGSGLSDYMSKIEDENDRTVTVYAKWSDVLYNLDFEDPNDVDFALELMKQLAPVSYRELIDAGYGLVDDGTGNHVFKIAYEGHATESELVALNKNANSKITRTATLPITPAEGLEGLYEVTYTATFPETYKAFGGLMVPKSGDTTLMSVYSRNANPWFLFQSDGKIRYQMFDGDPAPAMYNTATGNYNLRGGIQMRYLIDTIGNTMTAYGGYTSLAGNKSTDTSTSMSIAEGDDLDTLVLFTQQTEAGGKGLFKPDIAIDNIIVKKITQPEVDTEITTIKDGDIDVPTKPTIKIGFTQSVDVNTLTTNNIYIQNSSGTTIDAVLKVDNSEAIPVVSLTPIDELARDSEYTLYVTKNVKQGDYPLIEYTAHFETVPYQFQLTEISVINEDGSALTDKADDGNDVVDLADSKTDKVSAKLGLRNFSGKETENYFVAAALVDIETGEQFEYHFATGTIALGAEKCVLDTTFNVADKSDEKYKIKFYIWDTVENGFSLWKEEIVKP